MDEQFFDPRNKRYCFRLDEYDCFYRKTGRCSLTLNNHELELYASTEGVQINDESKYHDYPENSVMYCTLLLKSILKDGFTAKDGIVVSSNSCSHYSVDRGQHRSCIGKRVGLSQIPLDSYSESNSICNHCYEVVHSFQYRVETRLNKSHWFIG
ncbi:MAG: hypothetical protein ACE3L7_33135 [Candidatus Pristimantibacillus sp.]